jgi:diguanylate cyclase (GGDEF)-like protein/PAS domain S-box-containing protein
MMSRDSMELEGAEAGLAASPRSLIERSVQPVMIHGERILLANTAFGALLGRDPEDLTGMTLADLVMPDDASAIANHLRQLLVAPQGVATCQVDIPDSTGQPVRLELAGKRVIYQGAPAVFFNASKVVREARPSPLLGVAVSGLPLMPSPRANASGASAASANAQAQATLDSIAEGLITTDLTGRIDFANRAAAQLLGRAADDMVGRPFAEIVSIRDEADQKALPDPVQQCLVSQSKVSLGRRATMITSADDVDRSLDLSAAPRIDELGVMTGVVVMMRDVTELRGMARQMSYQASHDPLTGLVNRREFERRLDEKLAVARAGTQKHVLCYLDLDCFKAVNDTSGHVAGDNMLREVAVLIRDVVRDSDTVARIGGDEFAILLAGCPLHKALQIAENVSTSIRDYRFVWKDKIFTIGVSIGMVEVGRETGGIEDAMAAADSACYVAKSQGRGHVHVYSARDEAVARQRGEIQWLHRLEQALREGQFLLYTQSIVVPSGSAASGPALEVLVRLSGDNGAIITPHDFIKAAERYRLMSLVDRWVVQSIFSMLGRGGINLAPNRSISINIAGQTLGDAQFLEFVVECFDRTGASPSQVCFEVTEASVVANLEHARRFIDVLHGLGCAFALDDFGSSLGSFANIKTLKMDFLKIDGMYMRHLDRDTVNQAMVAAMIELGRTLDFKVIAEQVEDLASLAAAERMGIDFMQGYAVAKPVPLLSAT